MSRKIEKDDGDYEEILINPTWNEVSSLEGWNAYQEVKGLAYKNDIYVWGSRYSTTHHSTLAAIYKIPYTNSVSFYFIGHTNTIEFNQAGMAFNNKPAGMEAMRKLAPKLKKAFKRYTLMSPDEKRWNYTHSALN